MVFPPRPLHPKVKRKKKKKRERKKEKNQVVVKYCIVIVGICIKIFYERYERRWRGMREIERDRERAQSPERDFLKLRLLHAVLFLYQVSSWCGGGEWGKGRGVGFSRVPLILNILLKKIKIKRPPPPIRDTSQESQLP